jgi:hypothetical protein
MEDPRQGLMSASAIDRRWHCAGSESAERDLPELKVEEVTETGNRIHESLYSGEDEELELSEREIKNRIVELENFAVAEWKEFFGIVEIKHTIRETRCWIRDEKLNQIASAQPDVFYIGISSGGIPYALVINYKTGFAKQTPSERNWQCRTEVLAVKSEYPEVQHVRGGIIASRLYSKLDTTDYTIDDINKTAREIQMIIWRSQQPDAPRVPGPHCRWCKARGICTESATMAMVTAKGLEMRRMANSMDVANFISKLDPADLKVMVDRSSLITEILEAAKQRLKGLSEETLALIGLKLVPGMNLKPITNTKVAYERLEAVLGKEAMMDVISVARGKAADILCEQQQIPLKAAKEQVDVILGDAITPKEGSKKLKPL